MNHIYCENIVPNEFAVVESIMCTNASSKTFRILRVNEIIEDGKTFMFYAEKNFQNSQTVPKP